MNSDNTTPIFNPIDSLLGYMQFLGVLDEEGDRQKRRLELLIKFLEDSSKAPSIAGQETLVDQTTSRGKYNILHILLLYVTNPESFIEILKSYIDKEKLSMLLQQKDHRSKTPLELAEELGNKEFAAQLTALTSLSKTAPQIQKNDEEEQSSTRSLAPN